MFAAGLITIPFDGVRGSAALGELGNELSFPFLLSAIALGFLLSLRRGQASVSSSLAVRLALAMLGVIFVSYLFNIVDIHSVIFRERSGVNKFATSLMVVLYGFGLAWLSEQVEESDFLSLIARYVCWSAVISILYVGIELVGRSGLLPGPFGIIDGLVHSRQADIVNTWDGSINQKLLEGWDERIRSVAFEPPAFGNYTGFAWPWVWYAAIASPAGAKRWTRPLLLIFTLVIVAAGSRTGLIMLTSNVAVLLALTSVYTRRDTGSEAAAAARLIIPIILAGMATIAVLVIALDPYRFVDQVVAGESMSNLSRLAFQTAGLKMFFANPVFGVGLGQFGFNVVQFLPDWAHLSSEVTPMITFPDAPWPAVYSVFGRLAAELGLLGLAGWCILWGGLAVKLISRCRRAQSERTSFAPYHFPVILNCVGVLVSGFTTDTFRTPMIWISLGLACAIIRRQSRAGVLEFKPAAARS